MSNAEAQQQEPSMEEILASIRRIISEDGEEADGQEPEAAAAEGSDGAAPEEEPAEDDLAPAPGDPNEAFEGPEPGEAEETSAEKTS